MGSFKDIIKKIKEIKTIFPYVKTAINIIDIYTSNQS